MLVFRRLMTAFAVCSAVCLGVANLVGPAAAQTAAKAAVSPRQVQVDLFRGLADIFSRGMDTLTERLNRQGFTARVYSTNGWQTAVRRIADRYARGDKDIVVLIGHSLGADATIDAANALNAQNIPVELIVTFDATHPHQVPKNVLHFVNFYQNNGFGKQISPGPGFQGELSNVDLTADTSLSHVTIEKSPRLHAQVIAKIADVVNKDLANRVQTKKPKPKKRQAAKAKAANAPTGQQ
ncbi:MAG TPA: lipase [Xanthobacteraceae bacterium]|nr:lipase [Xanthobacteraceae bacterium]